MKILLLGATGFVGRHLNSALSKAGHKIIRGVRHPAQDSDIAVDFIKDTDKAIWLTRLEGIDAVINVIGILRDSAAQPMRKVHEQTPLALFAACQEIGIKRIVQGSALGVDQGIETLYFQTRRAPEAFLRALPEDFRYLINRPSVIYGEDGASAKMFRLQASLPLITLPAGGRQRLQPVHIDDICQGVVNWLGDVKAESQTVACVGADATDLRGMLDSYRQQLGKSPALHISVPYSLVKLAATIGDYVPASPLASDTLTMLMAGNTADPAAFTGLLGRPPQSYRTFISGNR